MANRSCIVALILSAAWQVHGAVDCTSTGAGRFAEPTDSTCKTYTYCVLSSTAGTYLAYNYTCPSTSLFNPNTGLCSASYICTITTTTSTTENPTTTLASSLCSADGFIANPDVTDCSSYIECVLIGEDYVATTYDCPSGTFYNPDTTLCEFNYNCTSTDTFTCSSTGRFADTSDTTCQRYYLCVLSAEGTYVEYQYTCPSTAVFDPSTRVCTTSYTCTG